MWDFEHAPLRASLLQRYRIIQSTPAQCARRLKAGTADIGLVPVAAYGSLPAAAVIPRCAIASLDHVQSILLVVRSRDGVSGVRRVALDTDSLTSAAYTRIFFSKLWRSAPDFVSHVPDLEEMLRVADAALLIGDPALLALKQREARAQRTGERLEYIDLGHEWRAWTGTPWVSAFWAVREAAIEQSSVTKANLVEDFELSRDHGLAHLDDLAHEWSERMPLSAAELRHYFRENIYYFLDETCLAGLELFYRYAAECGALGPAPKLRFL